MRIAISSQGPDLDSAVDPRFGRSRYFIMIDSDSMKFEVIENPATEATSGAGIRTAQLVIDQKVDLVLTGRVGPKASDVLNAAGLKYIQERSGSVRQVVESYTSGRGPEGENDRPVAEVKETKEPKLTGHRPHPGEIVAVPSMDDTGMTAPVGAHFGKVPTYTLVSMDDEKVKVVPNTSVHRGGTGYPPELIASTGATTLVCGGLGHRAVLMFADLGLSVYVGATGTVQDAIRQYRNGTLQVATENNACKEHRDHDHGEGHSC